MEDLQAIRKTCGLVRKIEISDTTWLVPISGMGAGLLVTDSDVSHMSQIPNVVSLQFNFQWIAGMAAQSDVGLPRTTIRTGERDFLRAKRR